MKSLVGSFSEQLREAIRIADAAQIQPLRRPITHVLLTGLGGSAFGGEVVRVLAQQHSQLLFLIHRDYDLPGFAGADSLILVSSYSGNTEETLSAMELGLQRGAQMLCVSSGGKVVELAQAQGLNHVVLPGGYPPRAAAGFSLVQQIILLHKLGLLPDLRADLEEGIHLIEHFADHGAAEQMAAFFHSRIPVIYSSGLLEPAAIRLRQQIQENAKQVAFHHVIPEMNHNELVGWRNPTSLLRDFAPLFLRTSLDHPRNQARTDLNQEIIRNQEVDTRELYPRGSSLLAQLLYLIHFGDWVSLYLAELNREDPMPVKVIDYLKGEMGKR